MKTVNVGIIGTKFMGKAHSNAWTAAPIFFKLGLKPILKAACGQDKQGTEDFARQWGWERVELNWRKLVESPDIDIVDISTPNYLHKDIVMAAAQNGKHIFCEKPAAVTYAEAREMYEAAEKAGILHYLNHNYRRCPAITYARQLIQEDKIGRVFHWRGAYLQDRMANPNAPLTWKHQKKFAGAGPHFDLNSHSVDLARYLIGEISSVMAVMTRFVNERPLKNRTASAVKASTPDGEKGEVTVDDAAFMMVEFENGALGSFDSSRFASGRKNYNYFEIYGSKGSLIFNLERMNELLYLNRQDADDLQGFRTILVTNSTHPYMAAWWPPGHSIGYEHEFTHAVADFIIALEQGVPISPNLYDGMKCMQVLEAGLISAEQGQKILVSDIK